MELTRAILKESTRNPPSLEELGRQVGCSPFYLSRQFSAETGLTIQQYLRQIRLEHAAELLRTGQCNVTESALEVGYQQPEPLHCCLPGGVRLLSGSLSAENSSAVQPGQAPFLTGTALDESGDCATCNSPRSNPRELQSLRQKSPARTEENAGFRNWAHSMRVIGQPSSHSSGWSSGGST